MSSTFQLSYSEPELDQPKPRKPKDKSLQTMFDQSQEVSTKQNQKPLPGKFLPSVNNLHPPTILVNPLTGQVLGTRTSCGVQAMEQTRTMSGNAEQLLSFINNDFIFQW